METKLFDNNGFHSAKKRYSQLGHMKGDFFIFFVRVVVTHTASTSHENMLTKMPINILAS